MEHQICFECAFTSLILGIVLESGLLAAAMIIYGVASDWKLRKNNE